MEINKIADQIIDIPRQYQELRNISTIALLKETGYFEMSNMITEKDILEAVSRNPKLIEQWMLLSLNKRTPAGWYFNFNNDNEYVVGFYPDNENQSLIFIDPNKACAAFILKEINIWKDLD